MKTIPGPLAAHLAQALTTTATLLKLTRSDGVVYAYTTHDRDLTLDGTTYKADGAFQPSQLESQAGLAPDSLEILGLLADDGVTADDIAAGRFDNAELTLALCNWADLSQGTVLLRRGTVGAITQTGDQYSFEIRGLMDRLQQTVGETCTRQCRYHLGEARCTVDLTSATYRKTGALTSTLTTTNVIDISRSEADQFFTHGTLHFTSGANSGISRAIKSFSGDTFTLWGAFPFPGAIGDSYTATAGCDKQFTSCQKKFSNAVNFGGFPQIPGSDAILQTPGLKAI